MLNQIEGANYKQVMIHLRIGTVEGRLELNRRKTSVYITAAGIHLTLPVSAVTKIISSVNGTVIYFDC